MKNQKFIKSYLISKNLRYANFLKTYKKNFLKQRKSLLKILTISLNKIHNTNYKIANFKILIGPWIDEFLKIYLLRKYHINYIPHKIKLNKNLKVLVNNDFSDFINNSNNLNFNLIFFSRLQNNFYNFKNKLNNQTRLDSNFFSKIKKNLLFFIVNRLINKSSILLINSKFENKTKIKLFFLSFFKIIPYFHYNTFRPRITNFKKKLFLRKNLENQINKITNSKIMSRLIVDNIPTAYVEDFSLYQKISKKIFFRRPKTIFTTTSHLDDEILKFAMMNWSLKIKPKFYISQHGGNYSVSNLLGLGLHDYEISDKYFTWGYKSRKKDLPSVIPQFNSKFKKFNKENKSYFTFILGPNISNDFQRYVYQNVDYKKLYKNRLTFVQNIENKKKLIFKRYFQKRYASQDSTKIIQTNLKIKSKNITNNFQIIFKSKLLIFDYFSTLFFEICNLNIPFIFILDEKDFFFSKMGKKLIIFLKEHNLLFNSGKDAAKFINNIDDIDFWWNNSIDKIKFEYIKNNLANINIKNTNSWVKKLIT